MADIILLLIPTAISITVLALLMRTKEEPRVPDNEDRLAAWHRKNGPERRRRDADADEYGEPLPPRQHIRWPEKSNVIQIRRRA